MSSPLYFPAAHATGRLAAATVPASLRRMKYATEQFRNVDQRLPLPEIRELDASLIMSPAFVFRGGA